ncbi:MAG: NnrS family protein [Phyllobacteriaceae bacterium]|nr:NnrS family protein [Phyllobacteriaceae bacterium]
MARTAESLRAHRGPALLQGGFRPFFLFAALWAAIAIALWLPFFEGRIALPTAFAPLDWHVHELLYGYGPAAIAGFLLTAVPNWTGRLPVVGRPLAVLVGLWALGRLAVTFSALLGAVPAAILDALFLLALAFVAGREVWVGKNRRNLKVVAVVALLALGNLVFHFETIRFGAASFGTRIGIAAEVMLIVIIGGRIVPSFTINWLRGRGPGRSATPFGRFDMVVSLATAAALALWVVLPEGKPTGVALGLTGLAHLARLARWAGWRTWEEKLVVVLHVAYAFVGLGFLLLAASLLGAPLAPSAALHAWTIGAIAQMTLAVMTRASLAHTGRPLHATRVIAILYLGAFVAVLARIAMGFGGLELVFLHLAAVGWLVAFAGFVLVYRPILTTPR